MDGRYSQAWYLDQFIQHSGLFAWMDSTTKPSRHLALGFLSHTELFQMTSQIQHVLSAISGILEASVYTCQACGDKLHTSCHEAELKAKFKVRQECLLRVCQHIVSITMWTLSHLTLWGYVIATVRMQGQCWKSQILFQRQCYISSLSTRCGQLQFNQPIMQYLINAKDKLHQKQISVPSIWQKDQSVTDGNPVQPRKRP